MLKTQKDLILLCQVIIQNRKEVQKECINILLYSRSHKNLNPFEHVKSMFSYAAE